MTPQGAEGEVEEPAAIRQVRSAQRRLGELDELPVAAHIETYDAVHAVLQDALAALDEA
ncbi:MAG: hypothetical protein ABI912_01040 [Actinomycetota bacterium]